ncbi:MAG: low specificity L-threonine aldolase [Bacteroidaceae bacterium]|nr:low specificity L-threonine aldolase [Bacteroidaceae bacterium]
MKKILFQSDYNEGAHPAILEALVTTNMEQTPGYGEDTHCRHAAELIKEACQASDADVHFLVGGTQANVTVISSILRPHQGVVCAASGHIHVHETGAVEHGAHKVLALPQHDGKITAEQVDTFVSAHYADESTEHMVQPGMVYISFPTEFGTLYSRSELLALSHVCHKYDMPLFIDGARLGYGLQSSSCDITLPELATLADVFTIGGTKQGALFGEAVVIVSDRLKKDFRYHIKQNGGMLAKGRLLGIQFEVLFADDLYFRLARRADMQAQRIRQAFAAKGIPFLIDSPTNQQFPILDAPSLQQLALSFGFSLWEKVDDTHTAVRFCTSWATADEAVDTLCQAIAKL